MSQKFRSTALKFSLIAAGVLSAGSCAIPDNPNGGIGQAVEAFGEAECGNSSLRPDVDFYGRIDPGVVSPQSYNTCYKSWIADVSVLSPTYTGPGAGGGSPARITVTWADTPMTDAATCTGAVVAGILYEHIRDGSGTGGTGWSKTWTSLSRKDSTGTWVAGIGCILGVSFEGMTASRDYRIAATARSANNSTRKLMITTEKPQIIR